MAVFAISACGNNLDDKLVQAAMDGNTEALKTILAKGADVNATDRKFQSTALMWAAHNGHAEAVLLLIEKGAAIDQKGNKGETALWFAAQKGQLETLKILAEKGSDINVVGRDGNTALAVARKNSHHPVVEYLVKAKASE
jgi:ankyrin repeat protein